MDYIPSLFLAFIAIVLTLVLMRNLSGSSKITEYRRRRYGLSAWWNGNVPRTHTGTAAHEYEGIEILADGKKTVHARQTRAPGLER